jgi:hypothetical protein
MGEILACLKEIIYAYKIVIRNMMERNQLGDIFVKGKILKWM